MKSTGPTATPRRPERSIRQLIGVALPRTVSVLKSVGQARLKRLMPTPELESRIIGEVGYYGQLTMTSLVGIVGNDQSQVSRSLKRLRQAGFVRRDTLRAPIRLSSKGLALHARVNESSRRLNRLLLAELRLVERMLFTTGIARLTRAAAQLLEREQRLDQRRQRTQPTTGARAYGPTARSGVMLPDLIIPRMLTLNALLQRGSFLAFKRIARLSNFESVVLAFVWEYAPVSCREISVLTDRHKSQVDRAARALIERGLIRPTRSFASHERQLERVGAGTRVSGQLRREVVRRERALLADFSAPDARRFHDLLERIEMAAHRKLAERSR